MIILSKEQIILLHSTLITETGGSEGIRDEQLLESAINAPFQTFDNIEVFPSIQQTVRKELKFSFNLFMLSVV